jgi:integrase
MPNITPTTTLSMVLSQKVPIYITNEEVKLILEEIKKDIDKAKTKGQKKKLQVYRRMYLFVEGLFQLGARVSELLSITPSHINRLEKTIRLPNLKRRKKRPQGRTPKDFVPYQERIVPITDKFRADLVEYCLDYGIRPDQKIFPFSRIQAFKIIRKYGKKAGIDERKLHPHAFRHGFAVHCIRNRVPLTVVQEWLGHYSVLNTTIYTKITQIDNRDFFEQVEW